MRTTRPVDPVALQARIDSYLTVDALETPGRYVRYLILGVALLVMVAFGLSPWLLAFLPVFFLSDQSFAWHNAWLRRHRSARTLIRFRLLQCHQVLAIVVFGALAIGLSMGNSPIEHRIAALLMFAQGINAIGIDSLARDRATVAAATLAFISQIVAAGIAISSGTSLWPALLLQVLVALTSAFFVHIIFTSVRLRASLAERTRELEQARRSEMVGRLASGVAHDFNNLLTVMRGNLDLIEEVPPNERARLLAEVSAAADRGGALVAQLMDRARPAPAARNTVELTPFLKAFQGFAERVLPANIKMASKAKPGLIVRDVEAAKLEAALLNLVINARDAFDGQGGAITLAAQSSTDGVVLTVTDDGPGMDEALLSRAAEPYVTTKDDSEGTGLGLPMVQAFAEAHGGHMTLGSAPGHGTSIQITLPS